MTYYDILGVSKDASNNEIKKAYKRLVKKYHPDVFEGDKSMADKKIKELNEAYETLSNQDLRKSYDEVLTAPNDTNIDFSNSYPSSRTPDLSPDEKYEDLYRHNYYKQYTTNYYGVSHDDLKSKNDDKNKISDFSRLKIIFFLGALATILIILLICLLSYVRNLLRDPFSDIDSNTNHHEVHNETVDNDEYNHRYSNKVDDYTVLQEFYNMLQNEIY